AFLNSMREFNLITFCKKTAPKDELGYMYLGIYFIMYNFTTMYATQAELLKEGSLILTVYQIMMVTGVVTAMYPIWPPRIKYELIMQLSWNVIIFYMLIFFSAFFVMVSDFGQLQFAVFILNILIVTILIGWKLGLSMLAIGFYLSSIFYKYYAGIDSLDFSIGSSQFMFIYTMIFAGTALLIFFKPKQEIHELTEKKNEHLSGRISLQEQELRESATLKSEFIRNVTHEYHAPMTGISSMAQILVENYDQLTDEQRKIAAKTLLDSSLRLETFDKNISSLSKLSKGKLDFKLEAVNLSELVEDSVTMCRKLYEKKPEDKEWILDIEEEITVNIDKYYFKQSIENLVVNAIAHCPKGKIEITLEKDKYGVHFSIRDEGVGIPTDELYDIFAEFTTSSRARTPSGGRGIGLTLCKKVIELHGGTIKAQSNGKKGAKFTFTLPGDVKTL
ncbi:MAG: sensor histidine kinase, partial [Rickettsiaceae bacterium]